MTSREPFSAPVLFSLMRKSVFLEKLNRARRPVVVDFWAPWCAPCRAISPVLEKLAAEYAGRVDLWKINTDEETALAAELRIFSIPTVAVYVQGEEVLRRSGMQPEPALRQMFEVAAGRLPAHQVSRLTPMERALRLGAGLLILIFAVWSAHSWVLALIGAALAFGGIYDRCPVWQALTRRFQAIRDKG